MSKRKRMVHYWRNGIRILFLFVSVSGVRVSGVWAQTEIGLVAHYKFENNVTDATGMQSNTGIVTGIVTYGCGVNGQAISLNGGNNAVTFRGAVKDEFDTEDFTVSFFMKPSGRSGLHNILTKIDTSCSADKQFTVQYLPQQFTLRSELRQTDTKRGSLSHRFGQLACWRHVIVLRRGGDFRIYVDGELVTEVNTVQRVDVRNVGDLILGGSACNIPGAVPFHGLIDELRVYNRALSLDELRELTIPVDRVLTRDTIVFLGSSVQLQTYAPCISSFSWSPTRGVAATGDPNTRITPPEGGEFAYTLQMTDAGTGCVAYDTVRITVIDPSALTCDDVRIPNAFTPNGRGPFQNETFGISNPFVLQKIISFEIFNRWGERLFYSEEPSGRWDGTYKGQDMIPGVYLYRLRFECEGSENVKQGSLTLIR